MHHGHGTQTFADDTARSMTNWQIAGMSLVMGTSKKECANVIVAISPEHYNIYKSDGWGRKDIEQALHHYTTRPGSDLVEVLTALTRGLTLNWLELVPKFGEIMAFFS